MADEHAEAKRWDELTDEMVVVYGVIRYVLSCLPVRIHLAHYNEDWEPGEAIAALVALNRARLELVRDQPLIELHRDLLQQAITDWLLAFDLAGLFPLVGDPIGWRLDALEHLIQRAQFTAGKVALDLGIGDE
ncbi:hypothetical protein [Actinomadura violacea]|uniref:Uncharacterized protein n=1 Tax=Actinomadura violacea TaxID=2819934 RepID=A0ABS3S4S4_9ACTN|nr:hypothetical protein [Actinomadura violacea]MBO2464014.1 hypothetical protein [Actinomadura violacea]